MNTLSFSRKILYGLVALAVLGVAYLSGLNTLIARAATLIFSPADCYTAAATTTLKYMSNGLATTTVDCPMGSDGANSAALAIQVNASSSPLTVFNIFVEESMDGVDWYPIPVATTTDPLNLAIRPYSTFAFATSTVGGTAPSASQSGVGLNGTQNRNHYILDIPVRMKRVRAYAGVTGANGAIWMQIIPKIGI